MRADRDVAGDPPIWITRRRPRVLQRIFTAYNHEHRHSGIGMHTPASVHFDTAEQIRTQRQATLNQAYAEHPERFTRRPRPPTPPETAWINPPVVQPQPTP